MIIVTGEIVARPESAAELEALALDHVRRSRGEPGCISHDVHRHAEDPLRFVFVERWADMTALTTHFAVPESGGFVAKAAAMSDHPPTIAVYQASEVPVSLSAGG